MTAERRVGSWVILNKLGAGGMGSVFRAHHADDSRRLAAVKFLDAQTFPNASARFRNEARTLSTLDHPAVCRFLGFSEDDDAIIMEFVSGTSLEDHLDQHGPMAPGQVLELGRQLIEAVSYLHAKGVVHRDLKLANLMLVDSKWIQIVDFGIALDARLARLTAQGMILGSLPYIPPEAWLGELLPEHADPYAIGVILAACLTGEVPFSGRHDGGVSTERALVEKASQDCVDPSIDGLPGDFRALIREMTARDPGQRLTRVSDIARRLRALEDDQELNLLPLPEPEPEPGPISGGFLAAFGAAGLSGVLIGGLVTVGAVIAAVGLAWLVWIMVLVPPMPATRDVRVVVTGVADDVPVHGWLGERPPEWDPARSSLYFSEVEPGLYDLEVVAGVECERLCRDLNDCTMCCSRSVVEHTIDPGHGLQIVPADLEPVPDPPRRPVWIGATGISEDWPVAISVMAEGEQVQGAMAGRLWWKSEAIEPGVVEVRIDVGTCADADAGCDAEGACPAGCRSVLTPVEILCGPAAEYSMFVPMLPPEGKPPSASRRAPTPAPRPAAAKRAVQAMPIARAAGEQVTAAQFLAFVKDHPEWSRSATVDAGRADRGYLADWKQGLPTGSELHEPLTRVSFAAAKAYCDAGGRGGLARVADHPHRWVGGAALEHRAADSGPAVRVSNGQVTGTDRNPIWTDGVVGVRCRR